MAGLRIGSDGRDTNASMGSGIGTSLVGAVLGAGANYLSNEQNAYYSRQLSRTEQQYALDAMAKQQEYNRENFDYQTSVNRENWRMEQDYNSPRNQIARFIKAGLNPNLMYEGTVTGAAGNMGSVSSANHGSSSSRSASVRGFDAQSLVSQAGVLGLLRSIEEIRLLREQVQTEGARRNELESQAGVNTSQSNLNIQHLDQNAQLFAHRLEGLVLQNEGQREQNENYRADRDLIIARVAGLYQHIDKEAQEIIESNARVQKMFADVVRDQAQLAVSRGELVVHQRQAAVAERHASVAESSDWRANDMHGTLKNSALSRSLIDKIEASQKMDEDSPGYLGLSTHQTQILIDGFEKLMRVIPF